MGNGTSTIKIKLSDKSGESSDKHFKVEIKQGNFEHDTNIEKITYKVSYITKNRHYNLVIEFDQGKKTQFTYPNPKTEEYRVKEVYSYYLKEHKQRPLIIGFKTLGDTHYNYRYHDLIDIKSSSTIDIDDIEYISESDIKSKLNQEVDIIKQEAKVTENYKKGYGCIYFSNKGEGEGQKEYGVQIGSTVKCTIRVTKKPFENSKYIHCVNYKIIYSGDSQYSNWDNTWYRWSNSYYYLHFYTGSDISNPGKHIFTYYPRKHTHTITEIDAYCSFLYINQPIFITLKTKSGEHYYSSYDDLDSLGSAYNYELPSTYSHLVTGLVNTAYEKKFNKVTLKSANTGYQYIKFRHYEFKGTAKSIPKDKKYKKYILISDKGVNPPSEATVSTKCLFSQNPSEGSCLAFSAKKTTLKCGQITNKPIEDSVLKEPISYKHHGMLVCYSLPGETALLAEIYKDRNIRYQFVRQDLEGDVWVEGKHEYNSDISLAQALDKVELEIAKRITYFLDNNSTYGDNKISVTKEQPEGSGYSVFKHKSISSPDLVKTKVLYHCKDIEIVQNSSITKQNEKIDKLDGKIFTEITTYATDTNSSTHLVINLKLSKTSYSIHRLDIDGTRWRQMNLEDLVEMGAINEELLGRMREGADSHGFNERLDRMLTQPKTAKLLLNYISVAISSIMVLIDKKSGYSKSDIERIVGKTGSENIPPVDIDSNSVTLEEIRDSSSGSCVHIKDYKLYMHPLLSATQKAMSKLKSSRLYIRLYWGIKMILLYDDDKEDTPPHYLEYCNSKDELYVYFNKEGNMPLILLYNSSAYKPKKDNYTSWVKIKEIKECSNLHQDIIKSELDSLNVTVKKKQLPTRSSGRTQSNSQQPSRDQSSGQQPGSSQPQSPGGAQTTKPNDHATPSSHPHNTGSSGSGSVIGGEKPTANHATITPGSDRSHRTGNHAGEHQANGRRPDANAVSPMTEPRGGIRTSTSESHSAKDTELRDRRSDGDTRLKQPESLSSDSTRQLGESEPNSGNTDNGNSDIIKIGAGAGGGTTGLIGLGLTFCKHIYVDRKDFTETPSSDFYRLYPGNEVRLFYTYWIKCTKVVKNGDVVEKIICEYDPTTKGGKPEDATRKVKATIHWMSKEDFYPATFRWYSRLFTKPDPKEGTEGELGWLENLNKESLKVYRGYVEKKATELKVGDPIQFERTGYFTKDPDSTESESVFNLTITLVDAFANKESLLHKETEKKKRLEAIAARKAKKTVNQK